MPVSIFPLLYDELAPCPFSEFHREQLSIENSMRDLDSAVGRLDNIFMSVYVIIAALIIAVGLVRIAQCRSSIPILNRYSRKLRWQLWLLVLAP
jgi:hypothetical protein